jgi:5-methylcytosine-specific restriction endonuclease McrA
MEAGAHMADAQPTQQSPLSAKARDLPCIPWEGRPSEYQFTARDVLKDRFNGGSELPWVYIVPDCGTKVCLQELHLRMMRAQRIQYPDFVCAYCGMPAYTRDHLLPVTMTGQAARKFVAVVPACGECNFAIGDRVGHRITERREEAHRHIERKHRKTLELGKRWSQKELAELGPNLRGHIESSLAKRDVLLARLAWPHDPEYDKRAFQKSGFDDPIAMELL